MGLWQTGWIQVRKEIIGKFTGSQQYAIRLWTEAFDSCIWTTIYFYSCTSDKFLKSWLNLKQSARIMVYWWCLMRRNLFRNTWFQIWYWGLKLMRCIYNMSSNFLSGSLAQCNVLSVLSSEEAPALCWQKVRENSPFVSMLLIWSIGTFSTTWLLLVDP